MDSSGSVELDDSQTPPLSPPSSPLRTSSPRGLFFQGPQEEEETPLHLVAGEALGDAGSVSGPGWSEELSGDPSDDDLTSSRASSVPDKPAALLSQAQMRATARQAVKIGTGMAHTVAAKTEAQQAVGLYLADDDDAANIGNPLADVMHRRGDIVGGKLSPDANDFLKALMGVAGYMAKQIQKVGVVRQLEAPAAAEPQPMPDVA